MYKERWQIEIVMRYYKSACQFDETRVHNDYSVIGSEFCDFLWIMVFFAPTPRLLAGYHPSQLGKF